MPDIWFPNLGIEIEKLSRVAFSVLGKDVYWYGIFIGLGVILPLPHISSGKDVCTHLCWHRGLP